MMHLVNTLPDTYMASMQFDWKLYSESIPYAYEVLQ